MEVEFRGLKQTLDRAKLRCRNSDRVFAELHWSLLAMAVAELFALKEQLARRRRDDGSGAAPIDPQKRSLAQTIRALRNGLSRLRDTPETGDELSTRLRLAVTDGYVRRGLKKARYRPRNPDKKPLGDPKLRTMNPKERRRFKSIILVRITN